VEKENIGTLELARMEKNSHWLVALMAGLAFGWVAFVLAKTLLPSPDATFATASALLICMFSGLYFGGQSSSIALQLSMPPILVRTRVWFGKYQRETRTPLNNIAWVRVVYADDCLLSIEAGTHGHETTSLVCIPYSTDNISVAERLCSEISDALHVTNKGFLASPA
jgi:hypothetical protein